MKSNSGVQTRCGDGPWSPCVERSQSKELTKGTEAPTVDDELVADDHSRMVVAPQGPGTAALQPPLPAVELQVVRPQVVKVVRLIAATIDQLHPAWPALSSQTGSPKAVKLFNCFREQASDSLPQLLNSRSCAYRSSK